MRALPKPFKAGHKGVPLEYFTFERVVIDECHEAICPNGAVRKGALAARELLGVAQPDPALRPLRARRATWGLTVRQGLP